MEHRQADKHIHTGFPSIDKPWLKFYSEEVLKAPLPECSMFEYLWKCNKDNLSDYALEYFSRKITYRELFRNIRRAAHSLLEIGVGAGDVVAVIAVNVPETIYTLYALNRIGAVPNMIDPRTSEEGIRDYIEEVNGKTVFVLDKALEKACNAVEGTSVEKIIILSPMDSLVGFKKAAYAIQNRNTGNNDKCISWAEFIQKGFDNKDKFSRKDARKCGVIVHTGGTTGRPKGVMLSDYAMNSAVIQCDLSGFYLRKRQVWLGVMPPFIAYGIGNGMHLPLCKGMKLVVLPTFDPNKYDKLLLKYKPNHIAGVPSHYRTLLQSKRMKDYDMSAIYTPVVGGDGTKEEYEREISAFLREHHCGTNLIKGYGMTEICAAVTASAGKEFNKVGSVGIPLTHSTVSIFDPDTGKELPYNTKGEICMQGPHMMLGYYNNPVETENVLRKHEDGSIWLHSGDLGYMDEDGCLFIEGRLKRMIIRHDGFKVYPTMIENLIMTSPGVRTACSVAVEDREHSYGMVPAVFVVLDKTKTDQDSIKNELIKLCKKELPEYAQPQKWFFIDDLPLTLIGKVDYVELEKQANE